MEEFLKVDHINFSFPSMEEETPVLFDVSFNVSEGEIITIVGPKGCGKSTLLSLIAGLLTPQSGFININGKNILSSGKSIGYMPQQRACQFQNPAMEHDFSCQDMLPEFQKDSYVQINGSMNTYSMITFINTYPCGLSACTKQRVSLIRSLLLESDFVLLDEPFSALEKTARLYAEEDILEALRKEKKTTLLVTNDLSEAIRVADRILILSALPGTIKKSMSLNHSQISISGQDSTLFQSFLSSISIAI